MPRPTTHTWDGIPIATEAPRGASVVVRDYSGRYLVLHRAVNGSGYEGDWAWTPPSGARQPGEPVYAAVLRELAEETGLADVEPYALDLFGDWALFGLQVPDDVLIKLDHEHDRYEWLGLDEAVARCAPEPVCAGLRRAATIRAHRIGFRPLTRDDLPQVVEWGNQPQVRRWWRDIGTMEQAEHEFGPSLDGVDPTRVDLVEVDGAVAGLIQAYRVDDDPDYAAQVRLPGSVGVDYLIGVPELIGRGLGPQMIWQYLRTVVLPVYPDAAHVVSSPDPANEASLRALEKIGFTRSHRLELDEPELLCVLDVRHFFGPGAVRDRQEEAPA